MILIAALTGSPRNPAADNGALNMYQVVNSISCPHLRAIRNGAQVVKRLSRDWFRRSETARGG